MQNPNPGCVVDGAGLRILRFINKPTITAVATIRITAIAYNVTDGGKAAGPVGFVLVLVFLPELEISTIMV